jgi:hypothetical protein
MAATLVADGARAENEIPDTLALLQSTGRTNGNELLHSPLDELFEMDDSRWGADAEIPTNGYAIIGFPQKDQLPKEAANPFASVVLEHIVHQALVVRDYEAARRRDPGYRASRSGVREVRSWGHQRVARLLIREIREWHSVHMVYQITARAPHLAAYSRQE